MFSPLFLLFFFFFFFFNDTATTEIYTLSLHDALPICCPSGNSFRAARELRGCSDPDRRPASSHRMPPDTVGGLHTHLPIPSERRRDARRFAGRRETLSLLLET